MDVLTSSLNCILNLHNSSSPDELAAHYNNWYSELSCPSENPLCFLLSFCPRYTPELRLLKAKARHLERLYRKSGITIHKEMHKTHILHYRDTIVQEKLLYYSGLICSNEGKNKILFSLVNKFLQPTASLPSHFYSTDICNSLMMFFSEKICKIHQDIRPSLLPLSFSLYLLHTVSLSLVFNSRTHLSSQILLSNRSLLHVSLILSLQF